VREGMDQYSVRHPRASRPTLGPGTRAGNSTDHDAHDKREDH
jgi:hypothetical protein